MATTTGLLSQTIANLKSLNQQLGAMTNLPASAQGLQQSAQSLFNTDVANLLSIQSSTLAYTSANIPQLSTAVSNLQAGDTTGAAVIVDAANKGAIALSATVGSLLNNIMATKTQVISFSNSLISIEQDLQNQIIALQVQVSAAESRVAQYNKEKYYFLALGPFGLVGLGIAIGLLVTWNNKANDLSAQASSMNAQAAGLQAMMASIKGLINNFSTAVSQISNINNSVTFLSADIQEVITDLNQAGGSAALIYLMTAQHEAETLATDAS